jgi:hypothetical protein
MLRTILKMQSLAPKYEKLANVFAGESSKVVIAKVDATEEEGLAARYAPAPAL